MVLFALVPIDQLTGNQGVSQLSSPYCFSDGSTCFQGNETSIPIADTFYESQPRNGGTPVYNGGYTIDTTMNWSPIG